MDELMTGMGDFLKAQEASGLRFYSFGTVAANKKRGSNTIEVYPQERLPHTDGEITDNKSKLEAKFDQVDGNESGDFSLDSAVSIPAEWVALGNTNRLTSPDVRRGERVLLLKYEDSEVIRWIEWEAMHHLRRLETVTLIYSNEREENKPLTEDNVYMFTVSTHDKHITLSTSKSDKEPFAYTLQINTKDGSFCLQDDDGNFFFLNSKERHWRMENKDSSFVDLNKREIWINAPDQVKITTKRYILDAKDSVAETTKKHTYKSQTLDMTTQDYTVKSDVYKHNSQSFEFTGTTLFNSTVTFGSSITVNGVTNSAGGSTGPNNKF